LRVYIIDDEYHVLDGLKTGIGWQEIGVGEVLVYERAAAALQAYREKQPDFIITDITMPDMSGLDFIREIRETDKDTPIIILSGYDDFEFAKEAISLNVSRYLLKPTMPTEIELVIREVVDELTVKRKKSEYVEEYLKVAKDQISDMREQFLMDLLHSGMSPTQIAPGRLEFYDLDCSIMESGIVACIKVFRRGNAKIDSEYDWHLYKFAVANIVREIVERCDNSHVLRFADDRLPIFMYGDCAASLKQRAEECAAEAIKQIARFLNLHANAGIGSVYSNPLQYSTSYRESIEAVEYLEQEGYQKLIGFDAIQNDPYEWPAYPVEEIRLIGESFMRRGGDDMLLHWSSIEQQMKRQDVPLYYVQSVCMGILNQVIQKMMEFDHAVIESNQPIPIILEMQEHRTKDSLMNWTCRQLEQMRDKLKEEMSNQNKNNYVEFLISYIDEHYSEQISFVELAQRMHLTRHYLSFLFKREMGVSFMQYLTRYRIEKAKEMLLSNEYLVYEVGANVGYQDPAYFSRIFKQVTDCSPVEYNMRYGAESGNSASDRYLKEK
jgi:two-component system response regulator YesN